ncbi:uncharacterized protein VTP21DRAFT_4960 [Calcarisporiella thermophila]|uniref:uncharacterized protein n=1 Tax=Calcarisporiella thermophila TaxID=911321 RepID=UPI0037435B3F
MLPPALRHGFSPYEIEFLAENELIDILPSYKMDPLHLICGTYGPFQPPKRTQVPLWLALTLKKHQKCSIIPPEWLTIEYLEKTLEEEREHSDRFSEMPYRYMETAHLLLESATDDIQDVNEIRALLKDLREARQVKVREGMLALEPTYIQMDNLSLMEINEIRPLFAQAFNDLHRLTRSMEEDIDMSDAHMPSSSAINSSQNI